MTTLTLQPRPLPAACRDAIVDNDEEAATRLQTFLSEKGLAKGDRVLRQGLRTQICMGRMDARWNGNDWEFQSRAS